jgi:hypothetical protein
MCGHPRAAQDVPMMINEGFTQLLVEERTTDLRSAGHWRWSRRRLRHSAAGHPAPFRPRG